MKKIATTTLILATMAQAHATDETTGEAVQQKPVTTAATPQTSVQTSPPVVSHVAGKPRQQKSWLGVSLTPIPQALSVQLSSLIPQGQGIMVQSVVPNSPATKAGLQDFDILLSFNHQKLFSSQQLANLVSASKPGEEVKLSIVRNGNIQDIGVILETHAPTKRQYPVIPSPSMPSFNSQHFGQQNMPQGFPGFWSHPFTQPGFVAPGFPQLFQSVPMIPITPQGLAPITGKSQGKASVMQQFESIRINQTGDGTYRAEVEYQQNDGEKKRFVFEGKYDDVRKQIKKAQGLPDSKKNSLLNALKNNPDQLIPDNLFNFQRMQQFPTMPSFQPFFNY